MDKDRLVKNLKHSKIIWWNNFFWTVGTKVRNFSLLPQKNFIQPLSINKECPKSHVNYHPRRSRSHYLLFWTRAVNILLYACSHFLLNGLYISLLDKASFTRIDLGLSSDQTLPVTYIRLITKRAKEYAYIKFFFVFKALYLSFYFFMQQI